MHASWRKTSVSSHTSRSSDLDLVVAWVIPLKVLGCLELTGKPDSALQALLSDSLRWTGFAGDPKETLGEVTKYFSWVAKVFEGLHGGVY